MRNYYDSLGLSAGNSEETVVTEIARLAKDEPELAKKASQILLNPVRKLLYDNHHTQYGAIAEAYKALSKEGMLDTNDWDRRLVEFTNIRENH